MQQSRRLVLVRHAKAEQDGPTDAQRPLAGRGRRDAAEAGRWLAASGVVPDRALVSAARRAGETWSALREGGGWTLEPDMSRALYTAEPESALDLVRETPAEVATLLVIGHNPTIGTLAQLLDDGEGDDDAGVELTTRGFPTCAVAVFGVAGWEDLGYAGARLVAYHVGRG